MFQSKMMSSVVLASVAAAAATGCVISPQPGDPLSTVTGLSTVPSGTIHVNAYNFSTSAFELVGTTTAGASPVAAAGTLCANSPALYYYSVSPTLGPNDWHVVGTTSVIATLQVQQVTSTNEVTTLYSTNNDNGVQCVINHVTTGCDFYNVAYNTCGYQLTEFTIDNPG